MIANRRARIAFSALALAGALPVAADDLPPPPQQAAAGVLQHSPPVTPSIFDSDVRTLPPREPGMPGDPIRSGPEHEDRREVAPIARAGTPQRDALLAVQENASIQRSPATFTTPSRSFPGQGSNGFVVPDSNGDVGPNHYIQAVNGTTGSRIAIYDKAAPVPNLLASFVLESLGGAGACAAGLGDPIVSYDRQADRWILTEMASSLLDLCVYVSRTADPVSGGWFAYDFHTARLPDYPKVGVWPTDADGGQGSYVVTANTESRPYYYAFNRGQMLAGAPATFQVASLPWGSSSTVMPADVDGPRPPPTGAPALFLLHRDTEFGDPVPAAHDLLELSAFDVSWQHPASSTLTRLPDIEIADFDAEICAENPDCIRQPGTSVGLGSFYMVQMYRLQYVNHGEHETLVGSFVTDADGTDHAGVRWFELRGSASSWSLHQEGTFAIDSAHRWMSSIAMDLSGNIALAYSVSSSAIYPGLRYTGRLWSDAPGTMSQPEAVIHAGTVSNYQGRTGDYAAMSLDPSDDCTFWFTGQDQATSQVWRTQIASFRFDACDGTSMSCAGSIGLAAGRVACTDTLAITLKDQDLGGAGTHAVSAASTTETLAETVLLTESPAGSGQFVGTLPVTAAPVSGGDAALSVADGDAITVRYLDASRCGTQDVLVEREAQVDCAAPTITNVRVADVRGTWAELRWDTDEPADSRVVYGSTVPPVLVEGPDVQLVTSHAVRVEGLPVCSTQFFSVASSDAVGNTSSADNGGSFFAFETLPETTPTFASPEPPMAIPVGSFNGARATIHVTDVEVVEDINVRLKITHPAVQDLVLYLIGPDYTTIELSRRSGAGANYDNTEFDDEATLDVADATGPFLGTFRPEQPLSTFDGTVVTGDWTLRVADDGGYVGTGTLDDFELEFTYPQRECGPSVGLHSRAVADSCGGSGTGGGNGIVDPGESMQLLVHAVNEDTRAATGVSARLTSYTPGVIVTSASSTYPDLAPGASAPGAAPYVLYVDSAVACGTTIVLRLDGSCNEGGWSDVITLRVGGMVSVTSTYFNNVSKPIPDLSTVRSFISVADAGTVQDVDVGLSISHNTPPDLDIFLEGPEGTRVELSTDNGGSVQSNYTDSVFDDEAATPITAGSAPFTGSFRPESPLSLLDGIPAFGTWTLEVKDDHAPFPGTLLRWSLTMQRLPGYSCETCVVAQPPPEVLSLAWTGSGKNTLAWSATPRAATYELHRGAAADLPELLDGDIDSCERMVSTVLSSGPVLTENPPLGSFFWYLIRGENGFGTGPSGSATAGARVLNSNAACPQGASAGPGIEATRSAGHEPDWRDVARILQWVSRFPF